MAGEGQILRESRLEKGLDLTQVEQATKIRVRYLEALEEENYKILPGPTYIKGFLRTYAKFLDVDQEEIIELYNSSGHLEVPVKDESIDNKPKSRPHFNRPAFLVLSGILTLAIVITIASLSGSNGKDAASNYSPTPLPTAPTTESEPKGQSEDEPKGESNEKQPSTPETPNVITAEPEELKAELVFTQDCWVVVNVDDRPVLQETVPQGATKELTAKEKIELVTVGNAGGVSITLNGKPYPSLGTTGEVVNNVVLEKDIMSQVGFNY